MEHQLYHNPEKSSPGQTHHSIMLLTRHADGTICFPVHVRRHAAVVVHRVNQRQQGHPCFGGRRRLDLWPARRGIITIVKRQ